MMAQVIQFPSGKMVAEPAISVAASPNDPTFPVVRSIRERRRISKQNRSEDDYTIMIARMARSYAEKARVLAQTKPNSEDHRLAAHMAGIAHKLPCNNLRIFTTPEDVIQGLHCLWRLVKIANLELELFDARRYEAAMRNDRDEEAHWSSQQDEADRKGWLLYERLVRLPAGKLSDVTNYKLSKQFTRGMGSIEWMRTHRPELASIIDDEIARLTVEMEARKAARQAKRKESGK